MGKLAIAAAAAALALSMTFGASAQTLQPGASGIQALTHNSTIIHKAACRHPGRWCPRGRHRVCGPVRCWCAPC